MVRTASIGILFWGAKKVPPNHLQVRDMGEESRDPKGVAKISPRGKVQFLLVRRT